MRRAVAFALPLIVIVFLILNEFTDLGWWTFAVVGVFWVTMLLTRGGAKRATPSGPTKVVEKNVAIRVPRWLPGPPDWLMKRLGATKTTKHTIYGDEEQWVVTRQFGGAAGNVVAGEAGTTLPTETKVS